MNQVALWKAALCYAAKLSRQEAATTRSHSGGALWRTKGEYARLMEVRICRVSFTTTPKLGGVSDYTSEMAEASQDTPAALQSQLATTRLFFDASAALNFANSSETKQKMQLVRMFCFRHSLLGDQPASVRAFKD
jgi:hypothetical protein